MASEYVVQIVHKASKQVVKSWDPGLLVEKEFEQEIVARVREKGVGVFRTEAHVLRDVREAIREVLYELKVMV